MIVTFYSYKGGVGRTQLVANLAACLCYVHNKRVLLIDWDLEAPGIHLYFNKKTNDIDCLGLIDLFYSYSEEEYAFFIRDLENKSISDISLDIDKDKYIFCLKEIREGKIDLMPAAQYSKKGYRKKILNFNWEEFYEERLGKFYIEAFKNYLKSLDYDYIFIDSRTGITDFYNICNVQIPDVNVFVIAPNQANFEGCQTLAENLMQHDYVKNGDFRHPYILPILSKLETSNANQVFWLEYFSKTFCKYLHGFLGESFNSEFFSEKEDFYEKLVVFFTDLVRTDLLLPYKASVANGENLVFSEDGKIGGGLVAHYNNIANLFLQTDNPSSKIIAQFAYQQTDQFVAIKILEKIIGIEPNHIFANVILIKCYHEMLQNEAFPIDDNKKIQDDSEIVFNKVFNSIETEKERFQLYVAFGTLLLEYRLFILARKVLYKAYEINPHNKLIIDKIKEMRKIQFNFYNRFKKSIRGNNAYKPEKDEIVLVELNDDIYSYPALILEHDANYNYFVVNLFCQNKIYSDISILNVHRFNLTTKSFLLYKISPEVEIATREATYLSYDEINDIYCVQDSETHEVKQLKLSDFCILR